MSKGRIRLIAVMSKADDPDWGSDHDNTYRGMNDQYLAAMNAYADKVAASLGSPHGKRNDGPYAVSLRSITTKEDGTVKDTGVVPFTGLSRQAINKMNKQIIKIGQELVDIGDKKSK